MRVLVVEDDDSVRAAVRRALLLAGYEVIQAPTGQEGLWRAQSDVPDAIVLDLGLPDIDGVQVCLRLREAGNRTPILMLTARAAVEDRVDGLEAGADDYLVKPYDVRELQARLKAIMRRHVDGTDGRVLRFAELELDPDAHAARIGDRQIDLTRTEFQLLELLMLNPRRVLSSELIYDRVWGYDFGPSGNALRVYVGYLRRKLEAEGGRTRSHLIGELRQELWARARPALRAHHGPFPAAPRHGAFGRGGGEGPQPQPGGGAPGYFQIVHPDGSVSLPPGETAQLPVNSQVLTIARRARGSFFSVATVNGVRGEILTVGDPYDHWALQVALPLTEVDSVSHGLLLPYGLLIAGGVLLAAILGLGISRTALRPIDRFVRRTEDVASELDHPQRLEETGPVELERLAGTFNRTLDALQRSIGAQRNLVADASHELRTPISALRSNIQIFLDSERLPAEEREGLQESILAELDELTQLVDNVVELARDSSPNSHREPVELDTLVREAVERTRRRAPGITFRLQLEPTVIQGAPDRIGRAVANLIDNARRWSPPDGAIEVTLHDGVLSVRDHGPGFNERDIPHVFDRFYRAADSRRLPGSGLGLAIVSQTARAHGGSASAGNAPDGGAVVQASFGPPLAQPDAVPEAPPLGIS
jgi:two-component system sensor histidine kinase MprB